MPAPLTRAATRLFAVLLLCAASALGLSAAHAAPATGWIRLAHLSPDTPAVDVYLSSFGRADQPTILRGVAYGAVSPYQRVPAGAYTVAMRLAGADAATPAVLSTTAQVADHAALTVAGVGENAKLRLVTITDDLAAPAEGQSKVRVVAASLNTPKVDVAVDGGGAVASGLAFADTSGYVSVPSGQREVQVGTGAQAVSKPVTLRSGGTYTLVVRDAGAATDLLAIQDFAASRAVPTGSVPAGEGGLVAAPASGGQGVPVVALAAGGAALSLGAVVVARRRRPAGRFAAQH